MKYAIYGVLLSVMLSACSQEPAKTSDNQAASSTASSANAGATTSGASSAEMEGNMIAPPKNATGALAQRVIYFDFDSSTIRSEFQSVIEAHAAFLKAHAKAKVRLEGNTDERGSREYNVALGQRRADSVGKAMGVLGVPSDRIETVSYGEEKPAVEGHDEAAWSKNRRVEIHYVGE